jgi:hypothetical protein
MDDHSYRREPGSRVGVLLVGLLLGAVIMTAVWVGVAGNPLSDANEIVFSDIRVADVSEARDSICWSENPARRDARQQCAILALDPEQDVPEPGDRVTVGVTTLRPTRGDQRIMVVYVAPVDRDETEAPTEPLPTE